MTFISIHAPLRERHTATLPNYQPTYISIHAPLRERRVSLRWHLVGVIISIHAPLRERLKLSRCSRTFVGFQSTLPYGSDAGSFSFKIPCSNFNPRSLTGATTFLNKFFCLCRISIHAPLRERPVLQALQNGTINISIHAPLRERHKVVPALCIRNAISIHAPLRERRY